MSNKNKTENEIVNLRELTAMTSRRLRQLNSQDEPSQALIQASKAHGTLVSSYMSPLRHAMQAAKMTGITPDLSFFGISPIKAIEEK